MKWFLTGDLLGIADGLKAAGQDVLAVQALFRSSMADLDDPGDYPLGRILNRPEAADTQVLVLDQLLAAPGYAKRHVLPWSGASRNRVVVGITSGDPGEYNEWSSSHRQCIVSAPHIGVHVSRSLDIINAMNARRAVLWTGDAGPLVAAVADALNFMQVDPRIYR